MNPTRVVVLALVVLLPLLAVGAEPVPEERLQGSWHLAEKRSTLEFRKGPDGTWSARTVASDQKGDVGKTAFERLLYVPAEGCFRGTLLRPEDGSRHDVTVRLTSPDTMEAVVRKFLFSKTLVFTRK